MRWYWRGPGGNRSGRRRPRRNCKSLLGKIPALRSLLRRYYSRQVSLHGQCFYLGLCEPVSEAERRIRETIDYVQDAENLADR